MIVIIHSLNNIPNIVNKINYIVDSMFEMSKTESYTQASEKRFHSYEMLLCNLGRFVDTARKIVNLAASGALGALKCWFSFLFRVRPSSPNNSSQSMTSY